MIIDTSVLIAYFNKNDDRHQDVKRFMHQLRANRTVVDLLDTVYEEVLAVLRKRHSKLIAIDAAKKMTTSSVIRLICINKKMLLECSRVFIEYQGKYSYVDCTLAVWAKTHSVKTIIAIDKHFSELGLIVIP